MKLSVLALAIGMSLLMTRQRPGCRNQGVLHRRGASLARCDHSAVRARERPQGRGASYELPPALVKRVDAGEPFDVLILSYDVEGLIKQGKLAADSRTVLGRIGIGVAIHEGAPKPDFGSVEKFKRMLLGAKSFATSGEGSSGRYVDGLIDRLGIPRSSRRSSRAARAPRPRCWRTARSISWCRACRR